MRLDLGCGKNVREGFEGVDAIDFGQKWLCDLIAPWKWDDESVEEAHASHFVEHLTNPQRVHFYNELYRVLVPGGNATIIAPYYGSERAYGDPTHVWPPVVGFAFYYLDKQWREANAPHTDYECDFTAVWHYNLHPALSARNDEYKAFAAQWFRESVQDIVCTLTKR